MLDRKIVDDITALTIETYGARQQLNHTNEELAELIVEVAKNIRGFDNRNEIVEEMADVLNCFEYLKMILEISQDEIDTFRAFKLNRTLSRIKEGYDPKSNAR